MVQVGGVVLVQVPVPGDRPGDTGRGDHAAHYPTLKQVSVLLMSCLHWSIRCGGQFGWVRFCVVNRTARISQRRRRITRADTTAPRRTAPTTGIRRMLTMGSSGGAGT